MSSSERFEKIPFGCDDVNSMSAVRANAIV